MRATLTGLLLTLLPAAQTIVDRLSGSAAAREFPRGLPPGTPARALAPFPNPLRLVQVQTQLDAAFGQYTGGAALSDKPLDAIHDAVIGVVVNLFLREVPLRKRGERARPME